MPADDTVQFVREDMDGLSPRVLSVGSGVVAVFSMRCPGKSTANEDAAAVWQVPGGAVLAVADGVGGHPGGEIASARALAALTREVRRATSAGQPLREGVLRGFDAANAAVLSLGTGAATTLVAVEIEDGVARTYHAGDSTALFLGQRGRIRHRSVDHSPVSYAVQAGVLDEDEALHHDDRNLISNAVGSESMHIELGPAVRLSARDTVLLASDGLFDNLSLQQIVDIVRRGPLRLACARLAAACLQHMTEPREHQASKPDDLTFLLYRPTPGRTDTTDARPG